ncbi:MAG TPA: hypothetical protein VF820_00555 [Patescibacteria group bacterium]
MRKFLLLFIIFSIALYTLQTIFADKAYAFTSCAQQPCCNGTDTDQWESASGEKVSSVDVSCSGGKCTAVLHLPNSGYNAIVWSGTGVSCSGQNWCGDRPFNAGTYTLRDLPQGGSYDVKVSTSNSSGNIVSGYGAGYPSGTCHFNFTAQPPPPPATNTPAVPPTATNTPTPPGPPQTTANVTFWVEGIDINNISNIIPSPGKHGQQGWPFTIYVYSGSTYVKSFTDVVTETTSDPNNPLYGTFQNQSFNLTGLASGTYKFYVSTPFGSLRTPIGSSAIPVTGGQNIVLVTVDPSNPTLQGLPQLIMGDIDGDNQITMQDYSIMVDCYGPSGASNQNCQNDRAQLLAKPAFKNMPSNFLPGDFNDNGIVDGIDYNTFLRTGLGTVGAGGAQN